MKRAWWTAGATRLGRDVAEFSGGGVMKRSEFGMVTEQAAISDEIRLAVRVRIIV